MNKKKWLPWDFPGSPVVKTPCFQCMEYTDLILGQAIIISYAERYSQKKKEKKKITKKCDP